MGNKTSRPKIYDTAVKLLSEEERLKIRKIYKDICASNNYGFSETDLVNYGKSQVTEYLLRHLFFFMKSLIQYEPGQHINDLLVNDEEFVVSMANIFKGVASDQAELITYLCVGEKAQSVKCSQLKQLIENFLRSYMKINQAESSPLSSWKVREPQLTNNFCQAVLRELVCKDTNIEQLTGADFPWTSVHSTSALEIWLLQCPVLLSLFKEVFHALFPISVENVLHGPPLVPVACGAPWDTIRTLLDLPSILFLNQALPSELRSEWHFLFHTQCHGESFSTMMAKLLNKGPSILIIEDTEGHIFGGFASQSWTITSQFIGSASCFLFQLSPVMDVYQPTGYNENYMYLNQGQVTMPNGLGMGGQLEYFGLWLDYEFGKGHSKAQPRCTTYNSPQLSKHEQFEVKTLEIWGVGPEPVKEQAEVAPGSILDKDVEAKAMLTMLNKGPVSEGLREEDATADSPEEHDLPPLS